MQIAWLNDINPWLDVGGTQQNDLRHIKYLLQNTGLNIDVIIPENLQHKIKKKYDLLIISNCVRFSKEALDQLTKSTPYIIFHHDYNFCKFRLYFSGDESCKACLNFTWWESFLAKADKNIFLSPLHREMFQILFKELSATAVIPSNIDVDFWQPVDIERKKNTIILVNSLAVFKGRYPVNAYITQHQEYNYTIVGEGSQLNHRNVTYAGSVDQETLRNLYSSHEYFLHLTENAMPFDRTVVESLLCGCKIIANKNIGSLSYPWNYSDREEVKNYLRQSGPGFADEVFEVLKKRGLYKEEAK